MAQRRPFVTVAFAQSIDGSLAAEPARQLHRIDAGAVIDVDEVEAHRSMADARLARTGLADLNFLPDQNFGTAGLVVANGMRHEGLLGMGYKEKWLGG